MAQIPTDSSNRKFWSLEEDTILMEYIRTHGEGHWTSLPVKAGLKRRGKSCRLRWFNYLHPNIKRGNFSGDEEELIIKLHRLLGNRWSLIAKRLPGRTDNDVKNYWNTHMRKKLKKKNNNHPSPTHPPLKNPSLKRREESCRLRCFNYLHPNIKRGNYSLAEEDLIIRLHRLLGNRWSLIAKRLPSRTENDVKNYWNTHLCKHPTHSPLKKPCKDCYWNSTAADIGENTNVAANGKSIAKCDPCENQTFTEQKAAF